MARGIAPAATAVAEGKAMVLAAIAAEPGISFARILEQVGGTSASLYTLMNNLSREGKVEKPHQGSRAGYRLAAGAPDMPTPVQAVQATLPMEIVEQAVSIKPEDAWWEMQG